MNTTPDAAPLPPAAPAHPLGRKLAWLVGGGLALVALGSLATALALRGPGAAGPATTATSGPTTADEPRETIVSTMSPAPRAATTTAPPPAATRCADCGVVRGVTAIERKGEATGLGAVGGAVAGGLLGSQMGGGSGKDAMTVIGAVGGGVAGHHAERHLRRSTEYRVRVQMADGSTRTLSHPTRLAVGDTVRVDGERLIVATRAPAPAPASTTTRTAQNDSRTDAPAAAEPPRPRSMAEAKRL